jgi:hypothetical protein
MQMSTTNILATVFGVVFLIVGFVGFVPAPPQPDAIPLTVDHGHGLALGLFPINTLHNVVHLLFGALGLLAAAGTAFSARQYFQVLAVSYILLAVLGMIPATQTTFGLIPIYGNDVWLHALIGLAAAVIGFTHVFEARTVARA